MAALPVGRHRQSRELPLTGRDVYNSLVLLPAVNADTTTAHGYVPLL
jgi:hypothetical protein